jgi:hypothetical protein
MGTKKDIKIWLEDNNLNLDKEGRKELKDYLEESDDFEITLNGDLNGDDMEFRFISDLVIEDIHTDMVTEMIQDEHRLPDYIVVNYEATAEDIRRSDGYGGMFAHYDGEELEGCFGGLTYSIFRIN